jgi:hypothetical protein
MEGNIEMVIKDWEDKWNIPILTQDIPTRKIEEESSKEET